MIMRKTIIIDTNIIYCDFWLKNPIINTLLRNTFTLDIRLLIPRIVIDESINKLREELQSRNGNLQNLRKEIQLLADLKFPIDEIRIDEILSKYKNKLEKTFIGSHKIIDYPTIPHSEIVARALQRKKPFKKDGSTGYRDTLIWENIKQVLLDSTDDIYFISNNTYDFYDNSDLHPELQTELKEHSIDNNRIKLFTSLKQFFEKHIKKDIEIITQYLNDFKVNELSGINHEKIFEDIIDHYTFSTVNISLPDNYTKEARIDNIYELEIADVDSVWKIDQHEYAINFTVRMGVIFNYFVDKNMRYTHEKIDYEIQDEDYNDHVMEVSIDNEISIDISITYNDEAKEIINIDYEL